MEWSLYEDQDPDLAVDHDRQSRLDSLPGHLFDWPINYSREMPSYLEGVMQSEIMTPMSLFNFDSQARSVLRASEHVSANVSTGRPVETHEEPIPFRQHIRTNEGKRRHSDDAVNPTLLLKKLATNEDIDKSKRRLKAKDKVKCVRFGIGNQLATNIQTGEPVPHVPHRRLSRPRKSKFRSKSKSADQLAFERLLDTIDEDAHRNEREQLEGAEDPEESARREAETDRWIDVADKNRKELELGAIVDGAVDFRLYLSKKPRYIGITREIIQRHKIGAEDSKHRIGSYRGQELQYTKRGLFRAVDNSMYLTTAPNVACIPLGAFESLQTAISALDDDDWGYSSAMDSDGSEGETSEQEMTDAGESGADVADVADDVMETDGVFTMEEDCELPDFDPDAEVDGVVEPMMQFINFDHVMT